MEQVTAVVLAAGAGKRLLSDVPKVLHIAAGRPLVAHVVDAIAPLHPARTIVVVAAGREEQMRDLLGQDVDIVVQDPPAGTGDAVRVALAHAGAVDGDVVVLPGDTPLLGQATLERMLTEHRTRGLAATIVSATLEDATGLGRIIRRSDGAIDRIVEERDATTEQREIREVSSGVMVFEAAVLARLLDKIDRDNAQDEYYLPDVISLLHHEGRDVASVTADPEEIMGVNDRVQLAEVVRVLRRRAADRWMRAGVTIVDPASTFIDATVEIGRDAVLQPFTFLEGKTTIGPRAVIGPQTRVVDSEVGEDAAVTFAVIVGSRVGPRSSVGPFTSLRAGTDVAEDTRVGTFVEMKQSRVGPGSKVPHLSYIGDAEIGRGVNVGAGTITCNWDGRAKHKTILDDNVYIGSDTMLVAPVHMGERSASGAGAVVRGDVPPDALAVGVPARIVEGRGNRMGVGLTTSDEDDPEESPGNMRD